MRQTKGQAKAATDSLGGGLCRSDNQRVSTAAASRLNTQSAKSICFSMQAVVVAVVLLACWLIICHSILSQLLVLLLLPLMMLLLMMMIVCHLADRPCLAAVSTRHFCRLFSTRKPSALQQKNAEEGAAAVTRMELFSPPSSGSSTVHLGQMKALLDSLGRCVCGGLVVGPPLKMA